MRFKAVIIGLVCVVLSIPSYNVVPSFISSEMNKLTGGSSSPMSYEILSKLGIPPVDTMVTLIQYSFVGLFVAGLGIIAFGIVSKNMPKRTFSKLTIESKAMHSEESKDDVLHVLKERLANGEITSSQYQDIRKVLEDKI